MNVRLYSVEVLDLWQKSERYAVDLLDERCRRAGLSAPNAAFLHDIVLTTLRHVSLLDYWLGRLTDGRHLDHRTRWVLRIGLCQLRLLEVPAHAAVNETVAIGGRAGALVNAVLRRVLREPSLLDVPDDLSLSVRFSHPEFLVRRWIKMMGAAKAEAVCAWNQQPAPVFVRINRLHEEAAARLAAATGLEDIGDDFFRCGSPPRELLKAGLCYAQDPSTAVAPRMLAPQPGERVLDACAAPGGKTALMAESMLNEGTIIACDVSAPRLDRLRENLTRMKVRNAQVMRFDLASADPPPFTAELFDRVLLDVPCSNTGVMRRRVDVRWRLREDDFTQLAARQVQLLEKALRFVKPGGALVYSTCSIDKEENQGVVQSVLERHPEFELIESRLIFPPKDLMDGAYAARLLRKA